MSQEVHSEPLLLITLFDQRAPSRIKIMGWWVGGGPRDFSVSPSPFGLDFGTLDFGLGLDNNIVISRARRKDVFEEN